MSNSKTTSNSCCINLGLTGPEGVQLHLSANVFTTKVLIVDTIFTSPTGDGTAILRGHPSHAKVQRLPSFFSYFKTLSNAQVPGIEPATFHSAVMRSTDCALPPVQSETQNNVKFQNMYTEILLCSTDECQPLDALKSRTKI